MLVPQESGKFLVCIEGKKPIWIEKLIKNEPTIWAASEKLATAYSLELIIECYPNSKIEFKNIK